ncbi:MAG: bifunctional 5,10-methylenetetrahydrofolate dehydrogenase/5,10-methenyltetrahydrofolate cyclohydrolase [Candidatus Liptonbacteria bacterium]|nr:bifunctional 5,10-methylenetetrahydrofolate dehydrogenase/5,10-methenyltetrahydrofolate cyclohydrolase [Candidatus Liptonbacteria bacterium]
MAIINGKQIAENILEKLKAQPKPKNFLAAVLVDDDEASKSFIKQKEKAAKELGIDFRLYEFPETVKNDELREEVLKIANHRTCGGIIVQLPLPEHVKKHYILNVIPREKDVDVLGERTLGAFYTGRNPVLPPAVGTLQDILLVIGYTLSTSKVAVVGLGFLVGKPISVWLQGKAKEIILFDEGSDFLLLKEANLVISGVGKAGIIKPDMLNEEAVVIDFGYDNGKGDFDSSSLDPKPQTPRRASPSGFSLNPISYTPTPHGTGPILVAKLLENFYKLCEIAK